MYNALKTSGKILSELNPLSVPISKYLFGFLLLFVVSGFGNVLSGKDETIDFNKVIRPLLAKNCFACHGPDEGSREADLRLDLRMSAIDANAIVPADSEGSELIKRILSDDPDLKMPPPETDHELTASEIKKLKSWIDDGANYATHWAFIPPAKKSLPAISDAGWPKHELDHFVLKKLEDNKLTPSPEADKLQWLRRVSLDLTGLPPTVKEADDFVKDSSEDAFEKVVDRLLKSNAYGEHWARMWLDLARYADTKGYEKDRHRDIWRYRDWVIDAFNRDMPYDQFTVEQLAGDLLPNRTNDQILATAFHRNTMTNEEGGTDNEEFRVKAVQDRVDTTGQVWMGLTMGCAKCHSHKYDPISIKDYYSFYAYFNQTQDNDMEGPYWPTPTAELSNKIADAKATVLKLSTKTKQRSAEFEMAFENWTKQFADQPLWRNVSLDSYTSKNGVTLTQNDDGKIIASGKQAEKDTWQLTFELSTAQAKPLPITGFRIEYFPQAKGGGDWPDKNVAIRELTAELVFPDGKSEAVKLANPRATFSQANWPIAKAIDGKKRVGWGLSPKYNEPQIGVFDFRNPILIDKITKGAKLRLTLDQEYGERLLLARSRFSVSHYPANWLKAQLKPNLEMVFAEEVNADTKKVFGELKAAQSQLAKLESSIPKTPVMLELDPKRLRETKIHNRGNFLDQGEKVQPSVVEVFGKFPEDQPMNRLGAARWLMQPENPLTARVMVNRIWARLFGVGIVETEEDFGTQGLPPSHPGLLDWLAVDFRENGWSVKKLLRSIVLSSTYRQTSKMTSDRKTADVRNRLLSRGPRFRLSAEMVRDQALAASGLLSRKIGGPSVMPPQPGGVWKTTYSGEKWKNAIGPDRYRRGLYTYLKRTSPYPAMTTFDAGSGEVCQIRRVRTNTPLQALVTLNDTAFVEAAGALAKKMESLGGDLRSKLTSGFRTVLIRRPTDFEIDRLIDLYDSLRDSLDGAALLKAAGRETGDVQLIAVANVLLNLDETMTKP